ncbi:hypothetical protein [Thiocapsa sp. UBA6158]|jgi:hypothetical protein|uniref:hypothetical protein n=1 Tax=Thiocapsa sp. UBA6158 TaxID=1947692 RepID=UPI0025E64467|nr:hypothetical protein [Thiocapsa sp. UBA6158]
MATEDTAPKRSSFGWIPKLSLWAVVIAFGYLYLSSVDRGTTGDTTQVALADESGVEAEGLEKWADKLGELTASAETLIADVTAAGADGFNKVVDKVKDLSGSAETETAETLPPEAAPTEVANAEPIAAEPAVVESSPAAQEPAAKPAPMQVAEDRPAASAFNRHSAPLPATAAARPTSPEPTSEQASEVTLEETAPAMATTASPPIKDAEATVFAESLMGDEPASGSADVAAPMSAPITQGFAPVPVVPQPLAPMESAYAPTMAAPGAPELDRRQDSAAEYRARMMAEYENMRRAADQRARAYWEQMQVPGPMAAPMGYPAYGYGPGYAPAYGAPAYQR